MKKVYLFSLLLFCWMASNAQTPVTETITTPGNYTFTVPAGVTSITVQCWGGGGAGGGAQNTAGIFSSAIVRASGGGGGGFTQSTFTVTGGEQFEYTVGRGGSGLNNGRNGEDGVSSFFAHTSVTITATGGFGGGGVVASSNTNAGPGGNGGAGVNGAVNHSGGKGGDTSGNGAGGGGGAGSTGNGTDGGNAATGQGGPGNPNGNGGAFRTNAGDGNAGFAYGGGGGGARSGAAGNRPGGRGADGAVIISYVIPNCTGTPSTSSIAISSASGCDVANFTLTATNLQTDAGSEYKFQFNQGTGWQDLTAFATVPSSQTAQFTTNTFQNRSYRVVVRCTFSGLESFSNEVSYNVTCWQAAASRTITTCGGLFYDSGGPTGNYANNQDYTYTFLPATVGEKVRINFTAFATEASWDGMMIYDGPNTTSPLISSGKPAGSAVPAGAWHGENAADSPGQLTSSHPTGAITIRFTSDGSNVRAGWIAELSCVPLCNISETPTLSIADESGCTGFTTFLNVSNLFDFPGNQYRVEFSTNSGASWNDLVAYTNVSVGTITIPVAPTVTTQYRVRALCTLSGSEEISQVVTRTIVSCFVPSSTGTGVYNVPAGVSCVQVQAWGAGGGGGRSEQDGRATGGGGGGAFVQAQVPVVSGGNVDFNVGQGGAGTQGPNNGGSTWFGSASLMNAGGGSGVAVNSNNGGAGGIGSFDAALSNAFAFNGGNGGNGSNGAGGAHSSGAGGGAAGSTASGGNGGNGIFNSAFLALSGFDSPGGLGASVGGGNGGTGRGASGVGGAGLLYGGGGGGGKRASTGLGGSQNGGAGANGILAVVLPATLTSGELVSSESLCNFVSADLTAGSVNFGDVEYAWYVALFNVSTSSYGSYITLGVNTEDLSNFNIASVVGFTYPQNIRLLRRTFSSCGSEGFPDFNNQEVIFDMTLDCAPPPANDLCSNAQPIVFNSTISVVSGYNLNATGIGHPSASCGSVPGNSGVWYTLTGTGGDITISTCANADFNTQINVYEGTCGALVCVGGNDDFCGQQSEFTFESVQNRTYFVLISGATFEIGEFTITAEAACATTASLPAPDFRLYCNPESEFVGVILDGFVDSYQWLRDNNPVSGANNPDFRFDRWSLGNYRAQVTCEDKTLISNRITVNRITIRNSSGANANWTKICNSTPSILTVDELPGATYLWRRRGDNVVVSTTNQLTVSGNEIAPSRTFDVIVTSPSGCTQSTTLVLLSGGSCNTQNQANKTDVNSESQSIGMLFYPNPMKDSYSIELTGLSEIQKFNVYWFDVTGKKVADEVIYSGDGSVVNLQATNLTSGVYFVNVENANYKFTVKVIVQK